MKKTLVGWCYIGDEILPSYMKVGPFFLISWLIYLSVKHVAKPWNFSNLGNQNMRPKTRPILPQKLDEEGKSLKISGKSRLVKYYNLI